MSEAHKKRLAELKAKAGLSETEKTELESIQKFLDTLKVTEVKEELGVKKVEKKVAKKPVKKAKAKKATKSKKK